MFPSLYAYICLCILKYLSHCTLSLPASVSLSAVASICLSIRRSVCMAASMAARFCLSVVDLSANASVCVCLSLFGFHFPTCVLTCFYRLACKTVCLSVCLSECLDLSFADGIMTGGEFILYRPKMPWKKLTL